MFNIRSGIQNEGSSGMMSRIRLGLLVLVLCSGSAMPASAQQVMALVNAVPVTSFDVQQRMRIAALTERRRLDAKSALQELIDDQVKLVEARRLGYRVTDEGVEGEYQKLVKANHQSERDFAETLRRGGIEPAALRDKIRADLAWVVLLRDQSRKGTQVTNDELEKAVVEEKKKQPEIIDYTLQSVIFVVPTGSSAAERERVANAVRARFSSCESGFEELRAMPDVAVRPAILRSTETLSPQLAALLAKTPVGRMTPAFQTNEGFEAVAVCARKVRENSGSFRSDVAVSLAEKKVTENAKSYLETLRRRVDIQMKR